MDFTSPIYMDGFAIVVPLSFKAHVWAFLEPFSAEVWNLSFLSIPSFLLAMGLAEYLGGYSMDSVWILGHFWGIFYPFLADIGPIFHNESGMELYSSILYKYYFGPVFWPKLVLFFGPNKAY